MARFGTEERLQHANRGWAVRRTTEIALTALGIVLLLPRGHGDSPHRLETRPSSPLRRRNRCR